MKEIKKFIKKPDPIDFGYIPPMHHEKGGHWVSSAHEDEYFDAVKEWRNQVYEYSKNQNYGC